MFEWIFGLGLVISFYNAWGGGANDCANSFATSVGSGVLTLKGALLIASIFEFSGAVLMGSHVTDMVRKQIVSIDMFEDNPGALMLGMLCANLASAIWLTIATYFKLPVSTTHSIIGSIMGFALCYGGWDGISWDKIGLVAASWIISPFLAGIFSISFFALINQFVFKTEDPVSKIITLIPALIFMTFLINTIFIIYKGSPQLELDETPFWVSFLVSFAISLGLAILARVLYVPYVKKKIGFNNRSTGDSSTNDTDSPTLEASIRTSSYTEAMNTNTIEGVTTDETNVDSIVPAAEAASGDGDGDANGASVYDEIIVSKDKSDKENIVILKKGIKDLETKISDEETAELHSNAQEIDPEADKLCSWVQIITACFSSFAHGSNDVANAVAPLAAIYYIYKKNEISQSADVPVWVLLIGGLGIVFGLATWGYKIIYSMGKKITKISPSRGFIIELASALTVIIASRFEIPVSTTHCQVGSIVGCGLISGINNIKWSLLKNIVMSWIVTLPVTALLSASLFSFAYFSPNELNERNNLVEYVNVTGNVSNGSGFDILSSGLDSIDDLI